MKLPQSCRTRNVRTTKHRAPESGRLRPARLSLAGPAIVAAFVNIRTKVKQIVVTGSTLMAQLRQARLSAGVLAATPAAASLPD